MGHIQCRNGRIWISNDNWGYTCQSCDNIFYKDDGQYKCKTGYLLIILPILSIIIISLATGQIIVKFSNNNLDLQNHWLWDSSYIKLHNYKKK